MGKFYSSSIINLCFLLFIFAIYFERSYSQTIEELKKQKENHLKEIELTKALLSTTKSQKEKTLNDLVILDRQINLRSSLITNINYEIELLNIRKDSIDKNISSLNNQIDVLKKEYASIIVNSYKQKDKNNIIMFFLSSNSFNQAYKRIKYFQQYSLYRKNQKDLIIKKSEDLILQKYLLQQIILNKTELKNSKIIESNNLQHEYKNYKSIVITLKKKEKKLKEEFDYQQKLTKKLDNEIAKLIEKEFKKDKEGKAAYKLTPEEKGLSDGFAKNKGILPWPTDRGIVVKSFGEHRHPVFKYVTTKNNGIDIATPPDADVRSIFSGEVKSIITIPGAHKVVLIRHGEFLTVYSNLLSVNVKVGDYIQTKTNLGTVYTNTADNRGILHFEIWHENVNLNPSDWIKRN